MSERASDTPLYSPKIVTGGEVTKTFSEVNEMRSKMRSAFSAIGVAVVFLVVAVQVGAMDKCNLPGKVS